MATVQTVMCQLLQIFDKYATADAEDDPKTMSNNEMKAMLKNEMPLLFKDLDNSEVNKLIQTLDVNGDSRMDFQEFAIMVVSTTCACRGLLEASS